MFSRCLLHTTFAVAITLTCSPAMSEEVETPWQAGVAKAVITPAESMWMAGYAARNKPSEGAIHDLYAKAVALDDNSGNRLVIVTLDLIGVPRDLRDTIEQQVQEQFGLPPESLMLNASHTHCGPELRFSKRMIYDLDEEQRNKSRAYQKFAEEAIVRIVGEAIENLQPARLRYTQGRTGFAMNRRLPTDSGVINSPNPFGPVDQRVPVLRVENAEGELTAILFGYACHNTTLGFYKFCGDYAGFAQYAIEEAHPGVTALFVMGCGGDQNPYPRRELALAEHHGETLALAVETALEHQSPVPISGPLSVGLREVNLEFATPPSKAQLLKLKETGNRFDRGHAETLLAELEANGRIRTEYPYLIQAVQFGHQITLLALAGEVVVDYSLRFQQDIDSPVVWVAGYSNDVFGYVPSLRVLEEGGYEGGGAMRYSDLPGPFAPSVENTIATTVRELVDDLKLRNQAQAEADR